jgi:hypothetical protein
VRRPTSPPFHRHQRGGISWVTALLVALLVGGGYLAWTYVPVYLLHYEAKQVVRDYANQAVRNPNDEQLVAKMVQKLASLDTQAQLDDQGQTVQAPTIQVEAKDVTWERDASAEPPTLHVQFEYTRTIEYPLLHRWTEKTLQVDITNDLTKPDWGPAR